MPVRRALALALVTRRPRCVASLGPITSGSVASVALDADCERRAGGPRRADHPAGSATPSRAADRAYGFSIDRDYLRWAERTGAADWWSELRDGRPSPITFWYRTSPTELVPVDVFDGRVESDDPPVTAAGMQKISLDARGRVVEFRSVPPETIPQRRSRRPPRAAVLGHAVRGRGPRSAHVHRRHADSGCRATSPTPPRAWEGPMPGRPESAGPRGSGGVPRPRHLVPDHLAVDGAAAGAGHAEDRGADGGQRHEHLVVDRA